MTLIMRSAPKGFTLTELAIVLLILGLLIGGLMMPLTAAVDSRNVSETRRTLAEIHEALLGFATAKGRLPCPANGSSGEESPLEGGNCTNYLDGFVPGSTLGLAPLDEKGFVLDAWGKRIRYAVFAESIKSVTNPFTKTNGMKNVGVASIAGEELLFVCSSLPKVESGKLKCADNSKLTDKAPVVVYSTGTNAGAGSGADEAENTNGNVFFVCHEMTANAAPNGEFDDLVTWLSPHILISRMITAGQLP